MPYPNPDLSASLALMGVGTTPIGPQPNVVAVPVTQPTAVAAQRVVLFDQNGQLAWPMTLGQDLAANSLPVTLPADQAPLRVQGLTMRSTAAPVLTVAGSYAANDYVGTSLLPWVFPNALRSGGPGTGVLTSAFLVDAVLASVAAELWLFSRPIVPPADSAAWTLSDADMALAFIGVLPFSTYYASAANSVSTLSGLAMGVWSDAGTTLFGALVTRGSPAYTSGSVQITLAILAD